MQIPTMISNKFYFCSYYWIFQKCLSLICKCIKDSVLKVFPTAKYLPSNTFSSVEALELSMASPTPGLEPLVF